MLNAVPLAPDLLMHEQEQGSAAPSQRAGAGDHLESAFHSGWPVEQSGSNPDERAQRQAEERLPPELR